MNVQLRWNIFMFDFHISLVVFLNQLKKKISIWKKMIERQQRQQHQQQNRQFLYQQQKQQFFNKNVSFDINIKFFSSRINEKTYIIEIVDENENESFADYCDYENEYFVN